MGICLSDRSIVTLKSLTAETFIIVWKQEIINVAQIRIIWGMRTLIFVDYRACIPKISHHDFVDLQAVWSAACSSGLELNKANTPQSCHTIEFMAKRGNSVVDSSLIPKWEF